MTKTSVFTQIIAGEIPGEVIYEDEQCAVLLTIEPITPGHCLIVPKKVVDQLWDIDDTLYQHLLQVAKRVAILVRTVYEYPRTGLLVEGFGVEHAHIHVFGFLEPLEPTIQKHANQKIIATAKQLKIEADKLRSEQL